MEATDPKKADNGTIRKKLDISIDKNSVHGSNSGDNAKENRIFLARYIYFSYSF